MTAVDASPGAGLARALCDLLERRDGARVVVIETHLCWILLMRRLAIKLKKPIRLPFVDYGDVAARRRRCFEELRLNRRFAPGLYRAVLEVRGTPHAPRFRGSGEPIDHVVCVRRLPHEAPLSGRNLQELDAAALSRFAARLSGLHAVAPVSDRRPACAFAEPMPQAILSVMKQLSMLDGMEAVARMRPWVEEQARALRDRWRARRLAERVHECHGDLHLGNLAMIDGEIVAFDAIDFDPALRRIDVMSDVAFLAMDLEAHGRADLAFGFIDDYLQASGDHDGVAVLRLHAAYRALVRLLATSPAEPGEGPNYLAASQRWTQQGGPRLVLMHGLSGSGKSTVARRLLQAAGAIRIRSDVERKRREVAIASQATAGSGDTLYSTVATRRTCARLARAAQPALAAGFPVIVDAALLHASDRRHFAKMARRLKVPFGILHCEVDDAVSRERLEARERAGLDPSDATTTTWLRQQLCAESLSSQEWVATTKITGNAGQIAAIAARWRGAEAPDAE
jgi:aminoglycoside phosphotransferase family enzyme/predicted kinase